MSALATRPAPSAWDRFCHHGKALATRAAVAHVCYRRGVCTRRAARLFRAMDESLEAGDGREAERLYRLASTATRRAAR